MNAAARNGPMVLDMTALPRAACDEESGAWPGQAEMVGRVLAGKYRVTRQLGRGGMGAVYEATSLKLGRRLAIKVPSYRGASNQATLRRLEREIAAGVRIESSHVARVLDWDTLEDGAPFVVMEYVPGRDLRRILDDSPTLSLARSVNLIVQACRGLAIAHALGVIHRDLKPSNLALSPELAGHEHCTILDFGVAKLLDNPVSDGDSTRTGSLVGTLAYMPPEQVRGEKDLDARVDVYALGAILYECLAGRRAFEADSHHALMYQILRGRPEPLELLRPDLPRAVGAVVARCMAPAREDRYDSVEQLAVALTAVMSPAYESSSSDATEIDAATGSARPLRRKKQRRLFGAATIVSLSVLSLWVKSSESPPLRNDSTSWPSAAATREAGGAAVPLALSSALPERNTDLVPAPVPAAIARAGGDLVDKPRAPLRAQPAHVPARQPRPRLPSEEPSSREEGAQVLPSSAVEGGDDPLVRRGYLVESPYASTTEAATAAKSPEAE